MGYADTHFHLLPGVDDGPKTMEEAVELASAAVDDATSEIVATPHVKRIEPAELAGRVAELQARLDEAGVPVRVRAGGELHPDDVGSLSQAQLEALAVGPPGRRWALLEAPLFGSAHALLPAAEELHDRGLGVVIAHPERSTGLHELGAERLLRRILARGGAAQVNAGSLTGYFGDDAREKALALIDAGLVHALASDAHRLSRGPLLSPARAELARIRGEEVARRLVAEGPRALLSGGIPYVADAGVDRRARRHGARVFGNIIAAP